MGYQKDRSKASHEISMKRKEEFVLVYPVALNIN